MDKILPQYRDSVMSHTFIYVPSYFDFVRLRNYLKKEDVSFASISEYSQRSEVSRARHYFQTGEKQFMLFSERFHFYKRCVFVLSFAYFIHIIVKNFDLRYFFLIKLILYLARIL